MREKEKDRSPEELNRSRQSNWTHLSLLNQSKPIRLRSGMKKPAAASATLLQPRAKRLVAAGEMLQERLDDAHENCSHCRLSGGMSIIINQNDDHEPETATSDTPRRRRRRRRPLRTKQRQLDKQQLHQHHHQHHHHLLQRHHHCQTISSSSSSSSRDQNQEIIITRQVKKLTRRRKSVCRQTAAPMMAVAICLAVAVSCALIGLCDCDSESEGALFPAQPTNPLHRTRRQRTTDDGGSDTVAPSRRVDLHSTQTKAPTRHRQELLSSMAENIERQHWGLSSRPAATKTRSPASGENDLLKQIYASHEAKGRPLPPVKTAPTTSKAELDLSRIMMMHETNAASKQQVATASQSNDKEAHRASKPPIKTTRWLAGDNSPLKLLSSSATSGGGGMNFLTGVVNSLLPSTGSSSFSGQQVDPKLANATTSANPFTPRANAKNYLMGPILGLGQMLMQSTSSTPFYQLEPLPSPTDQGVYSKPANSFLSLTSFKKSPPGGSSSSGSATSSQKAKKLLGDLATSESAPTTGSSSLETTTSNGKTKPAPTTTTTTGGWIKNGANQLAQSYLQDSFRDLLTLSQLPILVGGPVSTAPSDLEPGGKKWLAERAQAQQSKSNRTQMIEDFLRYAYILGNLGVRRKRDPLKVLGSSAPSNAALALASHNSHAAARPANRWPLRALGALTSPAGGGSGGKFPSRKLGSMLFVGPNKSGGVIKPRGVMWDMATDPTLAVTVFHLLERASVALPLGFLLMPFVHMIRNPFPGGGVNLGRILPARASHRSVDYEELAKRIDMMDKILSRAMRPTHRESSFLG